MNRVWLAFLFGTTLSCLGQNSPSNVPQGNPTQFPGDSAAWSIAVSYPHSSSNTGGMKAPSYSIVQIEVTQVDQVRRNVIHSSDGKVSERWNFPGYMVIQTPTTGVTVYPNNSLLLTEDTKNLGYDAGSFAWIGPSFYQGTTSYGDTECYHYKGLAIGSNRDPLFPPKPSPHEAWIDKKTLLPVAIDDGSSLGVFTFSAKPPDSLTPSREIAAEMKRYWGLLTPLKPTKAQF